MKRLKYATYLDQVHGMWLGKCLGGAAGAKVEGIKKKIEIEHFREIFDPNLPNDDLDIQLMWLETVWEKGPEVSSEDLAWAWTHKCWYPYSEYGYFLKNYRRGIAPPYSGSFNNSFFKEGMGCPIRSEIWGAILPGEPRLAAAYAKQDGSLDHADNSIYAEQFLAAIESMVFFEKGIYQLIQLGLDYIPKDCLLYTCIQEVLRMSERMPWEKVREQIIRLYGHPDFTNVIQNLGFVILALVYGKGDLEKTIDLAVKCGFDTDCTCATAGAIVGGVLGYRGIDESLKAMVQDQFVIGINIDRKDTSIANLARDTCQLGMSFIKALKGIVEITERPQEIPLLMWEEKPPHLGIEVKYLGVPSIGYNDTMDFEVHLTNGRREVVWGRAFLRGLPEGWQVKEEEMTLTLGEDETLIWKNQLQTAKTLTSLSDTNKLEVTIQSEQGEVIGQKSFGVAGAVPWKVYGPFLDNLEDRALPDIECMVNNAVYLHKPYVREAPFDFGEEGYHIVNAYEDLVPLEDHFKLQGQCAFYMIQEVEVPEERRVWLVIGNNDGFKLWVNDGLILQKDVMRYFTPCNNGVLVDLKKGRNQIVVKVLRRGEHVKWSMGIRKHEGVFWHSKEWYTDLVFHIS